MSNGRVPRVSPDLSGLSAPSVAVAICAFTFERWDDLLAAMKALQEQTRPPDEIVLVIDHNTDLFRDVTARLGEVAQVVENTHARGVSGGRNQAIEVTTSEVIVFLDDDAVPAMDWLERLIEVYAEPGVMAVGGSAQPGWPTVRPAQMAPELDWLVGCTYQGQVEERADVRNVWGCNMSMRREVFDLVGGFDENTGRVGSLPLGCEETELCIRLGRFDPRFRIVLEPGARVRHRVTPERTTWSYLRRRSRAEGLSKAAVAALSDPGTATSVERGYLAHVLPRALRREVGRGIRGEREGWQAAAGIVTAVVFTGYGYGRGRLAQRRSS